MARGKKTVARGKKTVARGKKTVERGKKTDTRDKWSSKESFFFLVSILCIVLFCSIIQILIFPSLVPLSLSCCISLYKPVRLNEIHNDLITYKD